MQDIKTKIAWQIHNVLLTLLLSSHHYANSSRHQVLEFRVQQTDRQNDILPCIHTYIYIIIGSISHRFYLPMNMFLSQKMFFYNLFMYKSFAVPNLIFHETDFSFLTFVLALSSKLTSNQLRSSAISTSRHVQKRELQQWAKYGSFDSQSLTIRRMSLNDR